MRIVFLKNGETIGIGEHREGAQRDVADDIAAVLIKRGVAGVAGVFEGTVDSFTGEPGEEFDGINESSSRGE
ncbi:hypothetical protein MNBD_DELTA01-1631 [hydrothermal vent metagenome]|uniref:Uncharacterized protein n=1 Tax=hydrothermal vent metagenome TaxID=652676 RepID=A0A3B0RGT0_9ZZZZ